MVRLVASKISQVEIANVGGSFQLNWKKIELSKNTMAEFITEILEFNNAVFLEGKWINNRKNMKHFDFERYGGKQKCMPFMLEEMRDLPGLYPTLKETGFYIAGFSPLVDQIIIPLCYILAKIFPKKPAFVGKVFLSGLRRFASKNSWATLQLEASGQDNGRPVSTTIILSHIDPYALTAIPSVAAIMQYLKGNKPSGIWKQAIFVEPNQFFSDMQWLGVEINSIPYLSS
jgi:saccharopine dehydrogenase (NAD+, L-lysine-forming)